MIPDITIIKTHDPRILTLILREPIDTVRIKKLDNGVSSFYFGDYWIDIDTVNSCCDIYELFLNGYKYNEEKSFSINTSDQVTFTFNEKYYRGGGMVKNSMLIKFSGGDRIKSNRNQYSGRVYQNIYTRSQFLEWKPDADADADAIDKITQKPDNSYYFLGIA